jgi:hypothetical protein
MIHCFGDSHTSILSGENRLIPAGTNLIREPFSINHLGPYLAYNLPRKNWDSFQCDPSDSVLFSFGEIDCRCHIHKHVTSEKTYQSIIENMVQVYLDLLSGYTCKNIYILDITPCLVEYPFKMYFDQSPSERSQDYHHQGNLEQRNTYKKYMSNLLEEECSLRGYSFLSTFEYALDNKELYVDDIHLSGQYVIEHIKNQLK